MKFGIIISKDNPAGENIKTSLLSMYDFNKINNNFENINVIEIQSTNINDKQINLYTIDENCVYFDNSDNLDAKILIFATWHKSKSGEKTLTVHPTGNYDEANYGGLSKQFSKVPAILFKEMYNKLSENAKNSIFEASMEATHHGPKTEKPSLFIEIGSLESEWKNKDAGNIIAKTIYESISDYNEAKCEVAIGIGGMHYCNNFNKIMTQTDIAISHMCPKYNVKFLNKEMINDMITATYENVSFLLLDWKGLSGEEKAHLKPILEILNIEWKKVKQVKN